MKKLIILLFMLLVGSTFSGQENTNIESIKKQIDSLEKRLEDANYVRIPKKDYEDQLNNSIRSEVGDSILKWMGGLATLIGLFGFAIAGYFKGQINEQVENTYKSKIKEAEADLKNENQRQDNKLRELTERIDKLNENQAHFFNESAMTIERKLKETLSFVWDDIAVSKYSRAQERKFSGADLIQSFIAMLENKSMELKKETCTMLIDGLMRCYYHTPDKDKSAQYKSMIELLRKYEAKFELRPETYANAAIALANNYELYGVKADRDTCIESCDKSISRLQDYGTSYAIKLEVFMMDWKKAFNDEERQAAVENTERTLKAIENNKSGHLCFEIVERLEADREVLYLKPYIELLESMFPDKLADIKQRACSDIVNNKFIGIDRYNKIFNAVLKEHLEKTPVLDGDWVCSKVIEDGKEYIPEDSSALLLLHTYDYTLQKDEITEKGLIHFIPYTQYPGINFYKEEGKGYSHTVKGIYKLEEGRLVICSNSKANERPAEFSSTPANGNVLAFYERIDFKKDFLSDVSPNMHESSNASV